MPQLISLPNEVLLAEVSQLIREGYSVTLTVRGFSMRPFLEDRRDKAVLAPYDTLRLGDVILAEITPGHYVLHRIVGLDGDTITLMGDGNLVGRETCTRDQVRGRATAFYRKGSERPVSTGGRLWKTYSALWTRLLPVRRYLLAFYRLVWLRIHPSTLNRHTNETQKRI